MKYTYVRGHICDGLRMLEDKAGYSCVPSIAPDGTIQGCDDYNPVVIEFCPMCGTKLSDEEKDETNTAIHG
jgi:hypothetical protein